MGSPECPAARAACGAGMPGCACGADPVAADATCSQSSGARGAAGCRTVPGDVVLLVQAGPIGLYANRGRDSHGLGPWAGGAGAVLTGIST